MEANDRSKRVLAALVREYIASGEPVASSLLVTAAGLGVSSATVRSILARLEDEGYRAAAAHLGRPRPDRSRLPLLRGSAARAEAARAARPASSRRGCGATARASLIDSLLPQVSHVAVAGVAAASASPSGRRTRRPCSIASSSCRSARRACWSSSSRAAVTSCRRSSTSSEPLQADDLRQAANYLNAEFSGLPLHRAREAVLERMNEERLLYDALLARAMRLATSTFSDLPDDRAIYVDGAASLLDDDAGLTLGTLQALVQMIEEKQRLVRLLNEYIDGPGLTVVIGAEHPDPNLRSFSLVASTYDDGTGIGTVGVIGPTRMHYSRAIAVVDGAAQAVSRVLRDPN